MPLSNSSACSATSEPLTSAVTKEAEPGDFLPDAVPASYSDLLRAYLRRQEHSRRSAVALAAAAHELKTPLAVMSGYLEMLLSEQLGTLNERQRQVLTAMQSSGVRLQNFVHNFLTFGALETGKLQLALEPGDLDACLADVVVIWARRFQAKEVALYFPAREDLPRFKFDYHKVQRIISNLLENAYAWTPAGGSVWLTSEPHFWERRMRQAADISEDLRRRSGREPNSVRVSVSDTGPGIAAEFHQEIFDEFFSLQPADHAPGTGLGLAIARRLVQAHQGKIWVESEPGSGAKFSFLLPFTF
jgi:signal transduction histidine kinase